MDYQNLWINLQSRGEEEIVVEHMVKHPSGDRPLRLAFAVGDIQRRLAELEKLIITCASQNPDPKVALDTAEATKLASAKAKLAELQEELGCSLYEAIFYEHHAGIVADLWHKHKSLRLRLTIDPSDSRVAPLLSLPWELMRAREQGDAYARLRQTPMVRYGIVPRQVVESLAGEVGELPESPELRVLFAAASPDQPERAIDIDGFREWLEQGMASAQKLAPKVLSQTTIQSLDAALRDSEPHILVLLSHGVFDPQDGIGYLGLKDQDQDMASVTDSAFAEILKGKASLRLVVLATCSGGALRRRGDQHPYANVAAALLLAGMPAVIAMQHPISEEAVRTFCRAMFADLAKNLPVEAAVAAGRMAIYQHPTHSLEWATPVLFSRADDGRLVALPEEPEEQELGLDYGQRLPLRAAIRSIGRGWGVEIEQQGLADRWLKLEDHFRPDRFRVLKNPDAWNTVLFPAVADFLEQVRSEGRPVELILPCCGSLAFAAGYSMERCNVPVSVVQRARSKRFFLWPDRGPEDGKGCEGPDWRVEERELGEQGGLAVALSVSTPIHKHLNSFIDHQRFPAVRRVVWFEPEGGAHPTAIFGAAHARRLVQDLMLWLLKNVTVEEEKAGLHIFFAAPNSLMFYLGQQAASLSRVQIWELPFGMGRPGEYDPAIRLPL